MNKEAFEARVIRNGKKSGFRFWYEETESAIEKNLARRLICETSNTKRNQAESIIKSIQNTPQG